MLPFFMLNVDLYVGISRMFSEHGEQCDIQYICKFSATSLRKFPEIFEIEKIKLEY